MSGFLASCFWLLQQLGAAHAPVEVAPPTGSNQETIG